MTHPLLSPDQIDAYERDGAVLVKGLFKDQIEQLRAGIEHNMADPGPYAAENLKEGEGGRFFDDYCNWTRIPEFEAAIHASPAAAVAAELMKSKTVQMFHDHVLVKEPGTSKPTPWHQDSPYYFVEGEQTVSFGRLWTLLVKHPYVVFPDLTAGKSQSFQRVGWQRPVFIPTRMTICPCPILTPRA